LALAQDFPRVWNASTTAAKDRKRMLRLLIKDITVEKGVQSKQALMHIRWQGGACSDLAVNLPPPIAERLRYPDAIVEQVRTLAPQLSDAQIAEQMNRDGRRNTRGKPFTAKMIGWIRWRHRIPAASLKRADELTVKQVAQRFGVRPSVVYYWIEHEVIPARRVNDGAPCWITLDQTKEKALRAWVRNSKCIGRASHS
jgi:hypothetical protein